MLRYIMLFSDQKGDWFSSRKHQVSAPTDNFEKINVKYQLLLALMKQKDYCICLLWESQVSHFHLSLCGSMGSRGMYLS